MSNLSLERLLFDASNPADGPLIGSYLLGSGGVVISETGTSLDVNVTGAPGLAIYTEDSAAASGDDGQSVLLVREDTLAVSTSADGDYGHFKSTNKGELYVKAVDTDALLTTIDADTGAILTDTNAMVVDLAAIEVLITAGNALLTTIDADTGAILTDTNAMVVDLAAIEVLITSGNALLTTIDADTGAILTDTNAMVVDLAAIEVLLTGIDVDTDAIATSVASIDTNFSAALDTQGRVTVNDAPNTAIEDTAVVVGTTAVALPGTALTGRTRIMIQNNGTKPLFVGKTGVTVTNGIEVSKGSTLTLEAGDAIGLFGISSAAAQDIRVLELA
jgi:hypothetical protein